MRINDRDHSDQGASKEPMHPSPERIRRLQHYRSDLTSLILIQMIAKERTLSLGIVSTIHNVPCFTPGVLVIQFLKPTSPFLEDLCSN